MAASEPKPVVTGYPAAQQAYPPGSAATVTSYPYPAPAYYGGPPPTLPPAAPYYNPAYNRNNNTLFLRRLIVISIIVFLIIGAATFILWLVLRPHLPEFSVSSATVSSFNLSSSQLLSFNFNVTLTAWNPNKKMGIYYDEVEALVLYRSDKISETMLPPFYQGKRNATELHARFAEVSEYVDPDTAKEIAAERANGGAVEFHVRLLAWVRFRAGAWRTRRHVMRVYCDNVRIGFSGSLMGPSKQCLVDL